MRGGAKKFSRVGVSEPERVGVLAAGRCGNSIATAYFFSSAADRAAVTIFPNSKAFVGVHMVFDAPTGVTRLPRRFFVAKASPTVASVAGLHLFVRKARSTA